MTDPESWTHSFRGGSPGWQEPSSEADATEKKKLIQLGSPGCYFKGTQEPSQGSIGFLEL